MSKIETLTFTQNLDADSLNPGRLQSGIETSIDVIEIREADWDVDWSTVQISTHDEWLEDRALMDSEPHRWFFKVLTVTVKAVRR